MIGSERAAKEVVPFTHLDVDIKKPHVIAIIYAALTVTTIDVHSTVVELYSTMVVSTNRCIKWEG